MKTVLFKKNVLERKSGIFATARAVISLAILGTVAVAPASHAATVTGYYRANNLDTAVVRAGLKAAVYARKDCTNKNKKLGNVWASRSDIKWGRKNGDYQALYTIHYNCI